MEVLNPKQSAKVPKARIFPRRSRFVRTNKGTLADIIAKSRLVMPGDVHPDGAKPPECGGVRTDAPCASQLAIHILFSVAARYRMELGAFDVGNAYLSGKE